MFTLSAGQRAPNIARPDPQGTRRLQGLLPVRRCCCHDTGVPSSPLLHLRKGLEGRVYIRTKRVSTHCTPVPGVRVRVSRFHVEAHHGLCLVRGRGPGVANMGGRTRLQGVPRPCVGRPCDGLASQRVRDPISILDDQKAASSVPPVSSIFFTARVLRAHEMLPQCGRSCPDRCLHLRLPPLLRSSVAGYA